MTKRNYKYWIIEEIEYLKENYSSLDTIDLMSDLDRSIRSIEHKANRLNLTKNCFWTNEEDKHLKNNYSDDDSDSLKLNLDHHTWDAIKTRANLMGLKRNGIRIDRDFFKNWTKEMAYIFGFWIADGDMTKNKNQISFASNDYDLLEMIKSNLKSEHNIHKNGIKGFRLTICNRIIHDDLVKLGGTPAKSLTIQFPEVPDEFLSHFIRGEFDGDGCNYIHIDNKGNGNRYLVSSFAGNVDFLTSLKDKVKEKVNLDPTGLYPVSKKCNPRIKELVYVTKKAIALCDYMYQDSENLRLERKFKIYDEMKKEHIKRLEKKEKE